LGIDITFSKQKPYHLKMGIQGEKNNKRRSG